MTSSPRVRRALRAAEGREDELGHRRDLCCAESRPEPWHVIGPVAHNGFGVGLAERLA